MPPRGRHAGPAQPGERSGVRGLRWLAGAAAACIGGAVALAITSPAHAEATSTTATLTLLGVRDSNCQVQAGGSTVYVAPGGTVTFQAELAGIEIKTGIPLIGTIPITSSKIASFNDRLVVDGQTGQPHLVNGQKHYVLKNVTRDHAIAWTADSVQVKVPVLGVLGKVLRIKLDTIPLDAQHVTGVPVGGKLAWTGKVIASKNTKCGLAQVPGGSVHVGTHTIGVPPVTLPALPGPPKLPGTGKTTSGNGGHSGVTHPHHSASHEPGYHYVPPPVTVPQRVVPHPHLAAAGGPGVPRAGGFAPVAPAPGAASAADDAGRGSTPSSSPTAAPTTRPAKATDVSSTKSLGGAQLPVLLAIVAIVALSVVTAIYARRYLLRHRA